MTGPERVELASGVAATMLVMRPGAWRVDPAYRSAHAGSETRAAQILGAARNEVAFTPVPGPFELLATPQTVTHPTLGALDVVSARGLAALQAPGPTQSPLFLMRQQAVDLAAREVITNSNYFLFTGRDFDAPWNAYSDPIGLVLSGGKMDFAPQLPRACLLSHQGRGRVQRLGFDDTRISLPSGDRVQPHPFGAPVECGPHMAFARFFGAQGGASPSGEGYDLAYIGRWPVAGKAAGGMPIPRAGCVVRFPDRAAALESATAPLTFRLAEPWSEGVQAGPQILAQGALLDVQDVFALEHMTETAALPDQGAVSPAGWKANWDETRAARLGAGTCTDGQVVFVAIEGSSSFADRQDEATGATLRDLALLLRDLGATEALHLDGGGSTQVFGQAGGALIAPMDIHHGLPDRTARYDRPIPTWLRLTDP